MVIRVYNHLVISKGFLMASSSKNVMALYLTTALASASQAGISDANAYSQAADEILKLSFNNQLVDSAEYGDVNTLKILLQAGENPNQKGDFETTALLRATYQGNLEAVKALLAYGADPNIADIGGATPLHIASREGNKQIVDLLIKSGAHINVADKEGFTPLMRASISGDDQVVKGLVKLGANLDVKNSFGETAITQATKSKNREAISVLMAQEEKLLEETIANIAVASATNPLDELVPASGSSSWSQAVSNELFGSEFMLMAIADTKNITPNNSFNLLDFGSYKTEGEAKTKLDELKNKHADVLKGLNILVVEKTSGGSTMYHINAGVVESKEAAVAKCKALIAKNVICRPTETKMMLSAMAGKAGDALGVPEKSMAEAAPAPEVSKTDLAAPAKNIEVGKADTAIKPEVKAANIIAEKKPEIKPEAKPAENIGKFNMPEKGEEKKSFFDSLLGDDSDTKLPEPKLPEVKKSEVKPEVKIEPKAVESKVVESKPVAKINNPLLQSIAPTKTTAEIKTAIKEEKQELPIIALPEVTPSKTSATKLEIPKPTPLKPEVVKETPKEVVKEVAKAEAPKPEIIKPTEAKPEPVKLAEIKLPPLPSLPTQPKELEKPVIVESIAKPAIVESVAKPAEIKVSEAKPLVTQPVKAETPEKTLPPLISFKEEKVDVEELTAPKKLSEPEIKPTPKKAEEVKLALPTPAQTTTQVAEIKSTPNKEIVYNNYTTPIEVIEAPKAVKPEYVEPPAPAIITPQAVELDNAAQNYLAGKPSMVVTKKKSTPSYTASVPNVQPSYSPPVQQPAVTSSAVISKPSYVAPTQVVVKKSSNPSHPASYNNNYYSAPLAPAPAAVAPAPVVVQNPTATPLINPAPAPQFDNSDFIDNTNKFSVANPMQTYNQQPIHEAPDSYSKELWVSVGYFTNQSSARGFWNRMTASANPIYTKYRMKTKRPVGYNGKVSAEIGPIYNSSEAANLCNQISSEGLSCKVFQSLNQSSEYSGSRNGIASSRHSNLRNDGFSYDVVGNEINSFGYNNWSIQLGSYDTQDVATNIWQNLKSQHRILDDLDYKISKPSGGGSNGKLRLRAGSFTSSESAESVCQELRRNFVSCIIVRG